MASRCGSTRAKIKSVAGSTLVQIRILMVGCAAPSKLNPITYLRVQVTFDAASEGQLAMVIYEWADVGALGVQSSNDDLLPVRSLIYGQGSIINHGIVENIRVYYRCRPGVALPRRQPWTIHRQPPSEHYHCRYLNMDF